MKFGSFNLEFDKSLIAMGDLHGVWNRANSLIAKHQPSIVLQAGDFGWWPRFDNTTKVSTNVWRRTPGQDTLAPKYETKWRQDGLKLHSSRLYFCPGNHEDWVDLAKLQREHGRVPIEVLKNIYFMPRSTTLDLPDGRRVLFMGGASSIDKAERLCWYDWFPHETIELEDMDALPDTSIDIVVSHACPLEFKEQLNEGSTDWRMNDPYWLAKFADPSCGYLSKILHRYDPKYWIFGHYHTFGYGQSYNTKWFCLNKTGETGWWMFLPK